MLLACVLLAVKPWLLQQQQQVLMVAEEGVGMGLLPLLLLLLLLQVPQLVRHWLWFTGGGGGSARVALCENTWSGPAMHKVLESEEAK